MFLCPRPRIDVKSTLLSFCAIVKHAIEQNMAKSDRLFGNLYWTKFKRRLLFGNGDMARLLAYADTLFVVTEDGKGHNVSA